MTKVMFEDVEIGGGPEAVTQVVTPRQLVQYAAVSQDFTPIHYNTDYARSAGHDDIIIHGALKTALLSQMLADWTGDIGLSRNWKRRIEVSITRARSPAPVPSLESESRTALDS